MFRNSNIISDNKLSKMNLKYLLQLMNNYTLEKSDIRFEKYRKFRSSKMKKSFSSVQSERLEL